MNAPAKPSGPSANVLRLLEEHGPANLSEMDHEIAGLERRLARVKRDRARLVTILSMNRAHGEMDAEAEVPAIPGAPVAEASPREIAVPE